MPTLQRPGALLRHHVIVERAVGDLVPEILVAAEGLHRLVDLLEVGVLRAELGEGLVRCLEAGVENVLVNAVHPGQAGKTNIGDWDHTFMSPSAVKTFKRFVFLGFLISHTNEDAAKTQTYVSASKRVSDEHIHGELWVPTNSLWPTPWSWMRYTGSVIEKVQPHATDKAEWKRFWDFCDEAVKKAEGGKGVSIA